jgi:DNA modification methylase
MFGGGGAHKSHHANPGISKSAQRGGVPREAIYGKNGKQPGYYQDDDCLLKNPYGAGQEIDLISRKSHTCTRPVLGLTSGVVCPSLENKGLNCFFLESLGLTPLILFEQSNLSMPYQQQVFCPFGGLLLVVHQSTIAEFWQRLPALCLQMDNSFSCPLMLCSSLPDAPVFVHNSLAEPPYIKPYHINKLKAKDLCMIPFRLALALQADGWWLRSDIIWAKPNPMPEPCTDRPTRSHEYIFLLTKSAKYFWDQAAVRENNSQGAIKRFGKNPSISVNNRKYEGIQSLAALGSKTPVWFSNGRNLRSVWTITTQPFPGAHFATFPTKIVEICIKAGTSEKGCCPQCGAPWERVIEKTGGSIGKDWNTHNRGEADLKIGATKNIKNTDSTYRVETLGWRPTCSCQAGEPTSCTILDPFSGSGTTLLVAAKMGCQAIGCELSADYVEMSRQRLQAELGMLAEIEVVHLT